MGGIGLEKMKRNKEGSGLRVFKNWFWSKEIFYYICLGVVDKDGMDGMGQEGGGQTLGMRIEYVCLRKL